MSTFLKECFLQKTNVLSEEDEKDIKKYLEMKWTELYECRISRTDYNADENKRISICIFVKDNNKK